MLLFLANVRKATDCMDHLIQGKGIVDTDSDAKRSRKRRARVAESSGDEAGDESAADTSALDSDENAPLATVLKKRKGVEGEAETSTQKRKSSKDKGRKKKTSAARVVVLTPPKLEVNASLNKHKHLK